MRRFTFLQQAADLLSRPSFIWVVIGLLGLQAAWIALSGVYPMAFDEEYHLGLIKLFADHLSPFWNAQPAGADAFGAVVRDPSYLYHYGMSFPYRLIRLFTNDLMTQVLLLRAMNIGLFAGGLYVYRRVLLKTGASMALVHGCLLIFVLIPVVPLLAAQINYDNVFFLLVGVSLWLALRFSESLGSKQPADVAALLLLLVVGIAGSLIKYAFLPILLALLLYAGFRLQRVYRSPRIIIAHLLAGFAKLGMAAKIGLVISLLIAIGLAGERYGLNIIRYHTPVADCSQVLSEEQCSQYGPWKRDHTLELTKTNNGDGPHIYMLRWLSGMWLRLFFAVAGPGVNYQTRGPLTIPALAAIGFAGIGTVLVLCSGRALFRKYNAAALRLLLVMVAVYIATLWLDGYEAYHRTGKPVAINGRYLLPVLPIVFVCCGMAVSITLRRWPQFKAVVVGVAILCLLWGGGALTYILRSNDAWYWPGSPLRSANHAIQNTVGPVTPGYREPTKFLP